MLKLVPDWPKAVGFPASHLHGSTLSPAHVTQLLPRPYGRVQTPYRGYSVTPLCFSHYVEIEVHRARHRQRTHHCQRCSSVSFPCWRLRLYKNVRIILMMFLNYPWLLTKHVFFLCMCLSERCIHQDVFHLCWQRWVKGKYLSCAALEEIYLYCISKTLRSQTASVSTRGESQRGAHCWTIIYFTL